ncbi:MAG: sigma-70 family RNA polymerase sigma factor [Planctomycetes bacterium]|nr:sigma-70 family RNA polymerase sigma factor [Planctomycetota bacterium]
MTEERPPGEPTRGPSPFPSTHWSLLKPGDPESRDEAPRRAGLDALARLYWKPVYAHFRLKWGQSREEAEDLTQEFFAWIVEGPFLDRAEPGRGRFRNFVRAHLDHFILNRLRAGRRLKRGGGQRPVSIDFGNAPDEILEDSRNVSPEEALDRQWRRTVLDEALGRLRRGLEAEGRSVVYETLRRYDLAAPEERPTYARLAAELNIAPSDVDNHLSAARRRLYECLKEVIASSVDGPEALREELDSFFPGGGRPDAPAR